MSVVLVQSCSIDLWTCWCWLKVCVMAVWAGLLTSLGRCASVYACPVSAANRHCFNLRPSFDWLESRLSVC